MYSKGQFWPNQNPAMASVIIPLHRFVSVHMPGALIFVVGGEGKQGFTNLSPALLAWV